MVLGVAEVAYLKVLRERFDQGLSDMYWSHFSDGPDSVEDFLALLETLPISHDVHLDLEESNGRFWTLMTVTMAHANWGKRSACIAK